MTLSLTTAGRFIDNFNRANGALGANWLNKHGTAHSIVSNTARDGDNADGSYDVVVATGANPGNGAVEFRPNGLYGTLVFRSDGGNGHYGYNAYALYNNGTSGITLLRVVNGGTTALGSDATDASTTIVRIEFSGSSIKVYTGATAGATGSGTLRISVTDTTRTTGYCGISNVSNSSDNIDDVAIYTRANILVTSLPTGYYARLTDGTNVVDAAESSGTATITPSTAQGFGPWTLRVYNGNPTSGGTQQGADQTGVYGGDSWAGSGFATAPTVTDSAATSITTTTATGHGNVTSDGGAAITETGVAWGTSANPTTANLWTGGDSYSGAFTAPITSLTPGTLYYWRMFATNSVGTTYSTGGSFTTLSGVNYPLITRTSRGLLNLIGA